MEKTQDFFTPKTASKLIGVDAELLKTWSNEFSIQTERTEGNHRRYTKENIKELKAIKEKLHDQNWSYDQIRAWRNGEIEVYAPKEERSELEKKMDKLMEKMDKQERFNESLVKHLENSMNQMSDLQKENESLKNLISNQDEKLIESLKNTLETKQEEKKKKRKGMLSLFRS